MEKQKTLEQEFDEIEIILEQMENPDITLEDSFTLYEKGIKKIKYCNQIIDKVEKKMKILNDAGEMEDF